jgi:hypothetical protein
MLQLWKLNNKIVIDRILGLIEVCQRCPCESYLTQLKIKIVNGIITGTGDPVIIEDDLTLGTTSSYNLTVVYLNVEYGVQLEITPNGPEKVCGSNVEELTFDFKFIIGEELPINAIQVLNTSVPPANINCVDPDSIQRVPYNETLERHTAFVSHCQCTCLLELEAFNATFGIKTQRPNPDPPPEFLFDDPIDPENDIRFEIRYCYEKCPEPEEEE